MYQPSVFPDSKFQLPQTGCVGVLQLNVAAYQLPLQVYTQVEPEQAAVELGLAGQFPLVLVQVPPAISDIPHESGALQLGVLHWFNPETQTCVPVHCEAQVRLFLSAQTVTMQEPQDAPNVPEIVLQPPHALGVSPAQESEFLSALHAYLPHVPQLPPLVAPAGVSVLLQPPHALATSPVQVSEFLSVEQVSLPQLVVPQAALSVPVSGVQPPQAFLPGSLHMVLALSALHT